MDNPFIIYELLDSRYLYIFLNHHSSYYLLIIFMYIYISIYISTYIIYNYIYAIYISISCSNFFLFCFKKKT